MTAHGRAAFEERERQMRVRREAEAIARDEEMRQKAQTQLAMAMRTPHTHPGTLTGTHLDPPSLWDLSAPMGPRLPMACLPNVVCLPNVTWLPNMVRPREDLRDDAGAGVDTRIRAH